MKYPQSTAAIKILLDEIDWKGVLPEEAGDPNIVTRAFDYQAVVRRDSSGGVDLTTGNAIEQSKANFITISRLPSGWELNTNEGFTGISNQFVRISPFSIRRAHVSAMFNAIHKKINNYTGRPKVSTETSLTAALSGGSRATATVSSTTGFMVSEEILIDDEEVTIAEIDGSTKLKIDRMPQSDGTYPTIANGSTVKTVEVAEIQCCLLEQAGDMYEEESGFHGIDMFFIVVASY